MKILSTNLNFTEFLFVKKNDYFFGNLMTVFNWIEIAPHLHK